MCAPPTHDRVPTEGATIPWVWGYRTARTPQRGPLSPTTKRFAHQPCAWRPREDPRHLPCACRSMGRSQRPGVAEGGGVIVH